MWPFKKKPTKLVIGSEIVFINGTYSFLGSPFNNNTVKVVEVRNATDGTPWVKYTFGWPSGTLDKKLSKFLSIYTYTGK